MSLMGPVYEVFIMAGIGVINSSQQNIFINQQKTDAQGVTGNTKATRVEGQSQDNVVNVATSQVQNSQSDNTFAHQHHIAFNAFRNFGKDSGSSAASGNSSPIDESKVIDVEGEPVVDDTKEAEGEDEAKKADTSKNDKKANGEELTDAEQQEVTELKARDTEVRIHEQAHQSAGGAYAGAPSYSYETGPDGKRYATEGEVSIDISEEKDPEATIAKMQVVKKAALAPAEPSAQDRRVYASASQKEAAARQELNKEKAEEAKEAVEKAKSALNGESAATIINKENKSKTEKTMDGATNTDIKPPKIDNGPSTFNKA